MRDPLFSVSPGAALCSLADQATVRRFSDFTGPGIAATPPPTSVPFRLLHCSYKLGLSKHFVEGQEKVMGFLCACSPVSGSNMAVSKEEGRSLVLLAP